MRTHPNHGQIFDAVGWGNFDRPQGEPPGPTEKRRREEEEREEREKKRRRGEEKIMLTLGCMLGFYEYVLLSRGFHHTGYPDKTCKKALSISYQCLCLPTSLKLLSVRMFI